MEIKIERLEIQSEPLSIKTRKQGRRVPICNATLRQSAGTPGEFYKRVTLEKKDKAIVKNNCKRILNHPRSSKKQKEIANNWLRTGGDHYSKLVNQITRSMARAYKDF